MVGQKSPSHCGSIQPAFFGVWIHREILKWSVHT
jgi:hypothetical protein